MNALHAHTRRLLMLLILTLVAVGTATAAGLTGAPAPDFTLKSANGDNLKLSEFRGQVVMINFWASWCAPCRQEMPLLDEMYRRYQGLGFALLGVNVEEDSDAAKALLREIPVSFPILFDTKNTVSRTYNLVAMPSSVFVDRNGTVRYVHHGYKSGDEREYEQQLRALVRE